MKYNNSCIPFCAVLLLVFVVNHLVSAQSGRIVFREPVSSVHDSIVVMNGLLNKMADSNEKNYFFDENGFLFINNRKVGRLSKDGSINSLGVMAARTDLSQPECRKFLALSMFLKRNSVNGCIRHERYGVYFYIYQPAGNTSTDDFQYIVLYNERLANMTGTDEAESFNVLDRQKNLLLLVAADKKK